MPGANLSKLTTANYASRAMHRNILETRPSLLLKTDLSRSFLPSSSFYHKNINSDRSYRFSVPSVTLKTPAHSFRKNHSIQLRGR